MKQRGPTSERAVLSGTTLFFSILKLVNNVRQLFAAKDFSRRHFQMHILSALYGLI